MRDSKSSDKKPIQEVQAPCPRKPKLERVRRKVTKQKKVLKQISSLKELFKKTFLSLDSAAFILDDKIPPKITDCNPAATKIFGYDRQEFLGKTTQFLHINKKALKEFQNVLFPAIEKQGFLSLSEYRMKRKNGVVFPTEHSVFPLKDERHNRIGWISIVRDISARKEVEEQLEQSREFLANTINALDDTFFVKDEEHRWAALNDAACEAIGRPREGLIGKSDHDFFPKEQADKFWEKDNLVLETGETNVSEEEVTWRGKVHTISTKKSLFTDSMTGKRFIVGTARDISERKQMEKTLRESEQKYRALVEQSLHGIVILQDFRIVFANKAAAEIPGLTMEELHNLSFEDMMAFIPPKNRATIQERLKDRFAGKNEPANYELRLVRRNGEEFWLNLFFSPIEYQGRPAIQLAFTDITENKRLEQTLRLSEASYRELADSITDIFFAMDKKLRYTYWNKASEKLTGISAEHAIGKSIFDVFPDTEATRKAATVYQEVLQTQQPHSFMNEYRIKGKDFSFEINAYPSRQGISVFAKDITERKKAEEALHRSEKRFREIFENIAVGVYRTTPDGRILMANPALVHMLGYSAFEELSQRNLEEDGFEPQYRRSMFKEEIKQKGRIVSWESIWTTRDGKMLNVIENARAVQNENGKILYYEGTAENITERKEAEEALTESEEKFRNLAEQSPNMIFINKKGRVLYANKKCEETMGYKREEFYHPDFDFMTLIAPEFKQLIKTNLSRHMKGKEIKPYEYGLITKDGKRLDAIITTKLIKYDGEDSILGTITDITERKRSQEALKESEEKYRAIVERAPDGIVTFDLKGIITSCNTALLEQTGYSEQDFVGKHFSRIPTAKLKDIPKYLKLFGSMLRGKIPEPFEFVWISKDGTEHWGDVRVSMLKRKGRTVGFQAMTRDITERKRAEEKLREYQEQLKSLASELTLAEERERRRIATELHDEISQSLFISKIKLESLHKSVSDKKSEDTLNEISNSLGQILAAMRSLTFDLSSPILYEFGFEEAVAEWLNERVEKKYSIATELEDDGLPKQMDDDIRILLFRNVRELLINAVKHSQAKKIKVSIQKAGSQICVSVEDDGVGFDPTKAESMITSKEAFGLFSIRERLEHLGGNLDIKSAPGCGCRVTITSPLKREDINKDKQK